MDDRVTKAFNRRLDIYRAKRDQTDPFAADTDNRHDRYSFAIECIELLAHEAGIVLAASVDGSPQGGDHEDGRHAKHDSAVAATGGETPE